MNDLKKITSQCLKISLKVSFNIASEASYILSGKSLLKALKIPKMVQFGEFLKTWSLWSKSVTRQVNFKNGKCQNPKIQMRHFKWTKVNWKCPKWSILASFWKPEACGQKVLPDMPIMIWQNIGGKYQKLKCSSDILRNF